MNKSCLKVGDVVSLNGSKAALVVESLGGSPEAVEESTMLRVCWLDLDGHMQHEVLESSLLVPWTPPAEKPDHFPEVMAILSEAMKRVGIDSTAPDGAFEVDHRGSPQSVDATTPPRPGTRPQRPWTAE